MRAGHHHRPEALLTEMDTALTELVIPASAVLVQEERPFQAPFLASAHKLSNSGGFFCGAGLSGPFRDPHSRFASSSPLSDRGLFLRRGPARLGLGLLQFLTTAAVVDDPIDHAIVIL